MFGIIATIIAAYKGHKTFAWVIGTWTCIAIIIALSGYSGLAIAPGFIFFCIALGMRNLNKPKGDKISKDLEKKKKQTQKSTMDTASSVNEPNSAESVPLTQTSENLQIEATKKVSPAIAESGSVQLVCASCGMPLVEGAKFCRACGTPVITDKEPQVPEASEKVEEKRRCSNCGNPLFDGQVFCNKCGTRVDQVTPPAENEQPLVMDKTAEEAEPIEPKVLDLSSLPATLRRAYIFIEDEEWERAEEYLEKVLDEEPENAYAYLGKAMAAVKVGTPTLPTEAEMKKLISRKEYSRAKRFAGPELSGVIDSWENQTEGLPSAL